MLQYESIYIADPALTDDEFEELIKGHEQLISSAGARLVKLERWGRRRLSYTIDGREEGLYVLMVIECGAEFPRELERRYRMNDRIIRHLTVRVEHESQLGPSPMMKTRTAERDEPPSPAPPAPAAAPPPAAS